MKLLLQTVLPNAVCCRSNSRLFRSSMTWHCGGETFHPLKNWELWKLLGFSFLIGMIFLGSTALHFQGV